MICKAVDRLKNILECEPDIDIWIISDTGFTAKAYWKSINEYIKIKKKPKIFSSRTIDIDGLNPQDAIIILAGQWYRNSIVSTDIFQYYLDNAKVTFPIGEMPCHIECD